MTIQAKMIADSVSADGVRLCTLQLKYPRFIHAELMTHRMFSRNASSSRAIPISHMIDEIRKDPATPIHWGMNKPGMQATEREEPGIGLPKWRQAMEWALQSSESMADTGFHKQISNRLTEPFQHIGVIVTATEWDNFFHLRLHPDAQPEIQELARAMRETMMESEPRDLFGEGNTLSGIHLPYVTAEEQSDWYRDRWADAVYEDVMKKGLPSWTILARISAARCARVSYLNHDQSKPDIEKDINLCNRLYESGHMSPFEHIAAPVPEHFRDWTDIDGITHCDRVGELWSGNLRGWVQWRNLLQTR